MAMHRTVLTYEDYAALPDDGRRYEVHDGELSVTPSPGTNHQRVSRNLNEILGAHVRTRGLGEVLYAPLDVILANTTIVQPDLIFVAPTLAVEILSPSTTTIDRSRKLQLYARHGVPYYWIVDPDARAIEVYELADGVYRLVTRAAGDAPVSLPPFPDLAVVVDSLWP
jgi:Uma2 family endonuclease